MGDGTLQRATQWLAALLAVLLWAGNAAAKDETIAPEPGAAEPEFTPPAPPQPEAAAPAKFDIGFGLSGTTDYVSRGITQSDSRPAIQGYIEPTYDNFYANVWSSNVDFGEDFRGAEIDVAGGVRPQIGPLALNLGAVYYFYAPEHVSPNYGEFFAKADYKLCDTITLGTRTFFAPDFSQTGKSATFIAGGAKVALPNDFAIYGGVGYQFFEDKNAFEDLAWTAGLSYTWKSLTFDVRYWDTNLSRSECVVRSGFGDGCDARVVGSITFDYTLSKLRENNWNIFK
jgi:uncharacterized protein (TIGR02001 family)